MSMELVKGKTREGESVTWAIPFKWYKRKYGADYKPLKKVGKLLEKLEQWERVSKDTPNFTN